MTDIRWTEATGNAGATLVLAHGAGVGMDAPFMSRMAEKTAGEGIAVARFEFAYMAARRSGGPRRPPPRAEALIAEYSAALSAVLAGRDGPVLIGGKSMGGRVAAMLAGRDGLDRRVRGVVCLGYPFHPTGKPDQWRLAPLEAARLPVLIAQGERDPFGNRDEVSAVALPDTVRIAWLEDGDHDLKPRARAAADWNGNLADTAAAIAAFAIQTTSS